MTDSSDYPAAHSMDTMWFAIDAEGNVAVFESGEAGAVPIDGYVGEDYFELLEELRAAGHESGVIREVGEMLGKHAPVPVSGRRNSHLLLLRASSAIASELERKTARHVKVSGVGSSGGGVIVDALSPEVYAKIHDSGACLGCAWHFEDEEVPDPASLGLYRYEHSCENWISGPYQLSTRPEKPLRADNLPAAIVAHCVRVERPFPELSSINPPELWPCESWEPGWLHSDGKTVRPFPGREQELEEAAANFDSEFVIERGAFGPPPGSGNGGKKPKPWWKLW